MLKFYKILQVLLVCMLFFSCKKEEVSPVLDKEVRLIFPFDWAGSKATDFELLPPSTHLIKFNKKNYSMVNSITYYATIGSEQACCSESTNIDNIAYVELYNVTDHKSIANTIIQSSATVYNLELVMSDNIINELPDKEIDLAFRLKSKNGNIVRISGAYLILKRD